MILLNLNFFCFFFKRDNSKIVSCGGDRQVFYWDVATGRVIRKFRGHGSEVIFFKVLRLFAMYFLDVFTLFLF